MDLRPGVMVGDHARLVRPLGEGGMGTVWVAHHLRLDVEVAIKIIADPKLRKDPDLMERLRREARAAARINSPHVVHIYDQGALPDGSPFVLMELLRGESLAERIEREHIIDFEMAAHIVRQTIVALNAAHALSIVHRDIKPDNLYLCGDAHEPFVKVLDFGIALRHGIENPDQRLTTTDRIVGTPAFMSPEMLLTTDDPGPQADLWALSVTAYEMITGALPHSGETLARLMLSVTAGKHVPPRRSRPALPAHVDAWFATALALDIEERFPSGQVLSDTFGQMCERAAHDMAHIVDELDATVPAESDPPLPGPPTMARVAPGQAMPPPASTTLNAVHAPAPTTAGVRAVIPATMGGASAAMRPSAPRKGGAAPIIGAIVAALVVTAGSGIALWQLTWDVVPPIASTKPPKEKKKPTIVPEVGPTIPKGMVLIGAGTYPIGCKKGSPLCFEDEGPPHTRELSAFALMTHEVTRAEYAACVQATKCPAMITTSECSGLSDEPVRCVTWNAADAYCDFRSARLPTEVEWEAAARGVEGRRHPWGDEAATCKKTIMKSAQGEDGCGKHEPRAAGHPNDVSPLGVHSLGGNVREWTSSPYGAYPNGKQRPIQGHMINRGGSYLMGPKALGASHTRVPDERRTARPDLGMRCAVDLRD